MTPKTVNIGSLVKVFAGSLLLALLLYTNNSAGRKGGCPAISWEEIGKGLSFTSLPGPKVSKYADSKVTVVKIDPAYYDFELVAATQCDTTLRTAKDWCQLKNLDGAINAGMYSLKDHISGVGYMRNYSHVNNPRTKEGFNAMAVFNPVNTSLPPFQIVDMANQDWKPIVAQYNSCFQSIRMIDDQTQPVYWKQRRVLHCSMSLLALDKAGNVLYIFTRSPYTANEMIGFMLSCGLNIKTAMYLEGGPEATLYVNTLGKELVKFGSYVSYSKPDDNNTELRKMPNVLGFKRKQI